MNATLLQEKIAARKALGMTAEEYRAHLLEQVQHTTKLHEIAIRRLMQCDISLNRRSAKTEGERLFAEEQKAKQVRAEALALAKRHNAL